MRRRCRRRRARSRASSGRSPQQLDEMGDGAGGDRAAQLAKEARQLAEALEGGRLDATTLARQQQLFRRLLDAGRSLEKEEREDTDKREATSAKAGNELKPDNANASGARRDEVPRADVGRAARTDRRRAPRDPRVLQADQCGNSVARRGRGTRAGRTSAGALRRASCVAIAVFAVLVPRRPSRVPAHAAAGRHDGVLQGARPRGGGEVQRGGAAVSDRRCTRRPVVNALLGLERVYAELGWSDSLLAPLDTLIAAEPARRDVPHRAASHAAIARPRRRAAARVRRVGSRRCRTSAAPYREYARLLLQRNQRGRRRQRAWRARGRRSARRRTAARDRASSRRAGAVGRVGAGVAAGAAHRRLSRAGRGVRARADAVVGRASRFARSSSRCRWKSPSRRALAELEMTWGSPADGWNALKDLPPDSVGRGGVVGVREARRVRGAMDDRARGARVGAALEADAGARDARRARRR